METTKDDDTRLRLMLTEYAIELANETPVLCRLTDCIPMPDGLGGYAERERDREYRKAIMRPKDGMTLAACVDCLNVLRDTQSSFDAVRDMLNQRGCEMLAEGLTERRNRRAADIERMKGEAVRIAPTFDLPPELRTYDFDEWEAAAQTFNDGIAADVAYLQTTVAETLVAAFADYNDRLMRTGGKPILKAAAQFALPPDVSSKGARAVLQMLNNLIGIVPPAKFTGLTVFEIINAFERKYADLSDNRALIEETKTAATRAANNTGAIIDEFATWRKWLTSKRKGKGTKLDKAKRDAIWDKWQEYRKGNADCELPNGKLRETKRTIEEFYEKYGASITYTSPQDGKMWTLKQLCHTIDELKTAIDSASKSARRSATKAAKRKTDKKIR